MANGDVAYADIQSLLSDTFQSADAVGRMTQTEVDARCGEINAEVNLTLERLGITMPIATSKTDAIKWLTMTKLFGAGAYILDALFSLSGDEADARVERWWKMYESRLRQLAETGGAILPGLTRSGTSEPQTMPVIFGLNTTEGLMRTLMFREHARARQDLMEKELARYNPMWKRKLVEVS